MPSLDHEGLVLLFRNRPSLALRLIEGTVAMPLQDEEYRVEDSNLSQLAPTEYRADLVLAVGDRLRVVLEVQLSKDPTKKYSWPSYLANLWARARCPVILIVVSPSADVAAWAGHPIELGHPRFCLQPLVIRPGSVPLITDPEVAQREPELAVLSALWHGERAQREQALQVATSALRSVAGLDPDQRLAYTDLVLHALGEAAQRALEELMSSGTYEFKSEFARKYIGLGEARGEAKGLALGEAKGLAVGVITVLEVRGLPPTPAQRARIHAVSDLATLEGWLQRAREVDSVDQLFDEQRTS